MSANAVATKIARRKLMMARAGDITLSPICGMAFGSGGVDGTGAVIPPSDTQTALNAEIGRRPIGSHSYSGDTSCVYRVTLSEQDFAGERISEVGLYDADGDLVCVKNFLAKGKDEDVEMTFSLEDVL